LPDPFHFVGRGFLAAAVVVRADSCAVACCAAHSLAQVVRKGGNHELDMSRDRLETKCPAGYILSVAMAALYIFWTVVVTLLISFRKQIQEAIEEINNQLKGPPGPISPLPSTDAHLLLKRSRKNSDLL
jgi:hypothetical protein